MRHFFLAAFFIVLLASMTVLWIHRYQRTAGEPQWQLADLYEQAKHAEGLNWGGTPEFPTLMLTRANREPPRAIRLAIPNATAVKALHLRFRLVAHGLTPGHEDWQTGRIAIEWHASDGKSPYELDPVAAIKEDKDSGIMTLVAVPADGPAVPAIRMEHLGVNGGFELSALEMIAVEETTWWKLGGWALSLMSLIWLSAVIACWPGVKLWQSTAAAAVFLVMFVEFVIPGPWKMQRPLLGQEFVIGGAVAPIPHPSPTSHPNGITSGTVNPTGKIVVQGGLPLRIRWVMKPLKPVLHVALLAAPAFLFALLLGSKRAVLLALPLAVSIEVAQAVLGYGFDWGDVIDLLFDGIGIILGAWLYHRFFRGTDPQPLEHN